MNKYSILYVDDEESNLRGFKSLFFRDYKIFTAQSAEEGLQILEANPVQLVITDQRMPQLNGVEFLRKIIPNHPNIIRVILSGYSDIEVIMQAVNECGIFRYMTKPWAEEDMQHMIRLAFETYQLRKDKRELLNKLKTLNDGLEEQVKTRTKEVIEQKNKILLHQKELLRINQELTNLNEEKNEVIGLVAHDLKSPLHQIKGLATIIKLSDKSIEHTETGYHIEEILKAADRLNERISRILDISAIEAQTSRFQFEPLDISLLLNELTEQFKIPANLKEIALRFEDSTGNFVTQADKQYLSQVLENLLSNAIKYSEAKKVVVLRLLLQNDKIVIAVQDEGPGISKQDQKRLFMPYQKLSAKPTGNELSTGLGLAIAKKYINAMKGHIWCESKLGEGTTFFIELPPTVLWT